MSGRSAATALGKITWGFAIAFLATSVTLTIISAQNSSTDSVLDRIGAAPAESTEETTVPALPGEGPLLPPAETDAPLVPPRAD